MRYSFYIILLILAALNLRPAITSISPLMQSIRADLGLNGTIASLLVTLPVLGMGIFAPLALRWSQRWGMEKVIWCSLILIGLSTFLRSWAHVPGLLLGSALIAGAGIGMISPLLSGFIKKYFPRPAAMVSLYSVSMVIGAAIASGLAVPMQNWTGGSWSIALSCWSLLALIAAVFWFKLVIHVNVPAAEQGIQRTRMPFRQKRAWLLTVFFGLMSSIFYSFTAWLSPMMQQIGYSQLQAGYMVTLFTLTQIPVSFLIPAGAHRFGRRKWWLIGCSIMELIALTLLVTGNLPVLAVILLSIGTGGLFPLALMLPIQEAPDTAQANALSAMNQSVGYLLGAMGPLMIGWLYDSYHSFLPAYLVLAVVISVMILLQWRIGHYTGDTDQTASARPVMSSE